MLGDIGKSKWEIEFDGATYSTKENSFSIGGGYKFNNTLALEVTYRDLGSENYRDGDYLDADFYYEESGKDSFDALNISVVATLPVGEAAGIYGRLGIGKVKYKVSYDYEEVWNGDYYSESGSESDSKNRVLAGIGFQYAINTSFALRAEYSQYQKWEDLTLSSTTIGLTYQF